jgi:hypothetical protein
MEDSDFEVEVRDVDDLTAIKAEYNIPSQFQSCHTAIVDGYIIEGHVPVEDVNRLLDERPDVAGLAVPGMPLGSPGMEMPGGETQSFDVLAFKEDGTVALFASYSQ